MKRQMILRVSVIALLAVFSLSVYSQGIIVYKKDGTKVVHSYTEVDSIVTFNKNIPEGAVDLGLPSGTLWADRNIGADSPEGYGDYFAWGETRPKSTYSWSTYKYCKGSYNTLTKYCTDSSCGTVDNKTVLEPSDDAATANWGSNWRMPTHAEQEELIEKCTWTWTTRNGVNGYKVTGPNGNSIFLPAAGFRYDGSVYYVGSDCYCWSASLYESDPSRAWYMYFNSDYHGSYTNFGRYYGRSVRAVAR
jgi:hypothetical protein